VRGTPGIETLLCAVETAGEAVLIKHTFDDFHNPELAHYLEQRGKRFVLTAQRGYLVAVVEDCCADEPAAHEDTLNRYQFIFERTTVDHIAESYAAWQDELERLDVLEIQG
jgi:hypothetical protein